MNMIENKAKWGLVIFLLIASLIAVASSHAFRFTPTHSILKESHCHDCHGQELIDISNGTHIPAMPLEHQSRFLYDFIDNYHDIYRTAAKSDHLFLDSLCQSCHMNTLQFYRFELSDPYIFKWIDGNDSIYGDLYLNNHTPTIEIDNQVVEVNLTLMGIEPENASVDVTITVLVENFSQHQGENTSFSGSGSLSSGDHLKVMTPEIYPDYFHVIVILDSPGWNSSRFQLSMTGTSEDTSYYFIASRLGNYFLPRDISGNPYFHTRDYFRTERLDIAYNDFRSARVNNITALAGINTSTDTGVQVNKKTCASPDAVCHITQKTVALGTTIGFDGPDGKEGFYRHEMPYTTSSGLCSLCHLNGLYH